MTTTHSHEEGATAAARTGDSNGFEIPAKKVADLLAEMGPPQKIVLAMASRDDFLLTLRAFEAYEGWEARSGGWLESVVYEHAAGHTTGSGQRHSAPLVRPVRGGALHFFEPQPATVDANPIKLRRVHADRLLVFRHRGWEYAFRCRWSAATLSPGIESLVEQRAAPNEYAVVIGRSDWDAYAAANTTAHIAKSICMKVEDIRGIIL